MSYGFGALNDYAERAHRIATVNGFHDEVPDFNGGYPVGTISLYRIDQKVGTAELGRMMVDPLSQGKGYGTEAVRLVCAAAESIGIREIRLNVQPHNLKAIRVFAACGFQPGGAMRGMVRRRA